MKVNKIALNGFRNYEWDTAEFSGGTNVISGRNAQGKTNLLEAVYMLSCGRSFRTRFDRELIGFGCDSAEILADVVSHEREQTVRILLRSGVRKQITVNSVKKTASELGETLNVVLFCPHDLNLIKFFSQIQGDQFCYIGIIIYDENFLFCWHESISFYLNSAMVTPASPSPKVPRRKVFTCLHRFRY